MSLEYSDKAKISYARFYKHFNDITVYIEDKNGRTIYERLLRKMFPDRRISRVFSLNGREEVIKEWRKSTFEKGTIYIIDGDLQILFRRPFTRKGLIQLDRYAIENYFFDVKSIYENTLNYCFEISNAEVFFRDLDNLKNDVICHLFPIFVLYAIASEAGVRCRTVSRNVRTYYKDGSINKELVRSRKRELDTRKNLA
jgi:hypothetical protein